MPGEPCSNDLNQMVNFPPSVPDCDSHSPALLDFFLSSDTSICSTMAFSPLRNSDHVVVTVSAHGQCKNSQVMSQARVLKLIPLDCSLVKTLDMLDCQIVRSSDH